MGEGQATMLAVHKVYRSVLSNPTSTSLKLTIYFLAAAGPWIHSPQSCSDSRSKDTSQLLCCKLRCPSADSTPYTAAPVSHQAPPSQGCITWVKRGDSSFSSSCKPQDTTIQSSQSSKSKINTAPNPSISHKTERIEMLTNLPPSRFCCCQKRATQSNESIKNS